MSQFGSNSFITRSIEKSLKQLPALPDAVMKVVDETNKSEPSAARVEEHLSSDQALTSKVLKVVNSAYYGLSGQVASVGQAIVILGMQQVRNLVLSVGSVSVFEASTPRQQETLKSFWLHAFATASATQVLSQTKNIHPKTAEVMFVGGLLHDIGRLFLFSNFTAAYDQVIARAAKQNMSVEECERAILGMDHAEVGRLMAENWKLPQVLIDMIGNHEGPFSGDEQHSIYAVHVSDAVTKYLYYQPPVVFPIGIDPIALDWLGMDQEKYDEFAVAVAEKTEEASALYGLMAA